MFDFKYKKHNFIYNNLVKLSRNIYFYKDIKLDDKLENRIILIFAHLVIILICLKKKQFNKDLSQEIYDNIFLNIENNLREMGHGDVTVNKKMKQLVKDFYNILLNCEKYQSENASSRSSILYMYLQHNKTQNPPNNKDLTEYFDKYLSFCIDLPQDNVIKGEFNFKYK